jgi:hypothetical protein
VPGEASLLQGETTSVADVAALVQDDAILVPFF